LQGRWLRVNRGAVIFRIFAWQSEKTVLENITFYLFALLRREQVVESFSWVEQGQVFKI
jgi:hypothetical protein